MAITDRRKNQIIGALAVAVIALASVLGVVGLRIYLDREVERAVGKTATGDIPAYPTFVGFVRQDVRNLNARLEALERRDSVALASPEPSPAPKK